MSRFFVRIGHLSDKEMAFHGFTLITENEMFRTFRHYSGDDHIVLREDPYVYVDDVNDAIAMGTKIISW